MKDDSYDGSEKGLITNGTLLPDNPNRDVSHPEVWVMFILSLITIVGNALTFAAILSKKKLRKNPGNRFILSLCLADFCVGLFVMMPSLFRIQVRRRGKHRELGTHGTTAGYCVAGKRAQYRNIRPFEKKLISQIIVPSP